MQLNRLQLDLRPRSNEQALDLGFALLHANWRVVYASWLALWLPLMILCFLLACLIPSFTSVGLLLAWWLRPLLERAPLYVLSRQVFGEHLTWQQAVRAWPRQLGGGWFRLLTWWRIFVPSRGLYQAIWQLEGARAEVAALRRKIIGQHTAGTAYWFGVICANFEMILQLGLLGLFGLFAHDGSTDNPILYWLALFKGEDSWLLNLLLYVAYAFSVGVIAPIYVASTFTLYLNRRASLEAWDIEIVLRQIPHSRAASSCVSRSSTNSSTNKILGALLLAFALGCLLPIKPASAASDVLTRPTSKINHVNEHADQSTLLCGELPRPPQDIHSNQSETAIHQPSHTEQQESIRTELHQILKKQTYADWQCAPSWQLKQSTKPLEKKPSNTTPPPNLDWLAVLIKLSLMGGAFVFMVWLLIQYEGRLQFSSKRMAFTPAEAVAGLDIRPESLPADVIAEVLQRWHVGQQRMAVALLYRASLSHLVSHYQMLIPQGATEGECLRQLEDLVHSRSASTHQAIQAVSADCLQVMRQTTHLWLQGAYAHRWPAQITVLCQQWQKVFGHL